MRTPPCFLGLFAALFFLQPNPGFAVEPAAAGPVASSQKWEKEIAAFEKGDQESAPQKQGIVFVGSSSIRLWKSLATDFPEHQVLNRGFGGSQLADAARFAERLVLAYEPRFIVLYSGGNDINAKKTAEQVFEAFVEFVSKVREKQPETPIAYISIAGNPKRWSQVSEVIKANALIEAYTKQNPGLLYIDVFHQMLGVNGLPRPEIFGPDNLHMNSEGYKLWTQVVGPFLPKGAESAGSAKSGAPTAGN